MPYFLIIFSSVERHGSGSTHGQNHKRLQRAKAIAMRQHVGRSLKPIVGKFIHAGMWLSASPSSVARGSGRRQARDWTSLQSAPRDAAPLGVRGVSLWPSRRLIDPARNAFSLSIILISYFQRHGSADGAPCATYAAPDCWTEFSSFLSRFCVCRRGISINRPKIRIFWLVESTSVVFRPYFHVFAVAVASSRSRRVFCSDNWG